ncbi:MAG: GIY-YIG nuclease family protein [Gammaproteobacteria bacterium]|nr:GIY-YIG nuclease family protein [Gammaproteobacteria bacterium]
MCDINPALLPADKGTYVLVSYCSHAQTLKVGKLGELKLKRGYYFYVGSAFGPGGLRARLKHHLVNAEKMHWHFDYLKQGLKIRAIWLSREMTRYEHIWAEILQEFKSVSVPLNGVGATDCRCISHFFYSAKALKFSEFQAKTVASCEVFNRNSV